MMKKAVLFGLIFGFFSLSATKSNAQKFFEADNIDEAQIKVFPVWEDGLADLKIHIVYTEADLTGDGIWMEVPTEAEATIKIIFVDDESLADLKVILVDNMSQAGWNNESKKELFLSLIK